MARLSIPDEQTFATFTATAQTVFPVSFALLSGKVDLRVSVDGLELAQSAFTFSGTLLDGGGYQGGVVTLNTAATGKVIIWRDVTAQRASQFAPSNSVPVGSIDGAFNRAMALLQDVRRDVDRALLAPLGSDIPNGAEIIAAALATAQKADRDAGNFTLANVQSYRGLFALDDKVRLGGLDFASAGSLEEQIVAAASDSGVGSGSEIVMPAGQTLDYRGGSLQTLPTKGVTVNFGGCRLIPRVGDTFLAVGGGDRFCNVRVIPEADMAGGRVFILGGDNPELVNAYAERHYILADVVGGNGAYIQADMKNTAAGGKGIRIGSNAYTGPVTLDVLARADTAFANRADCAVQVQNGDVIDFGKSTFLQHKDNILGQPDGTLPGDDFSAILNLIGVTSDTATNALKIQPINGAAVYRVSVLGGIYSVMTGSGIVVDATGGTVQDVTISNATLLACAAYGVRSIGGSSRVRLVENSYLDCGVGFDLTGSASWAVSGGFFSGNSSNYTLPATGGFWRNPGSIASVGVTLTSGTIDLPPIGVTIFQLANAGTVTALQSPAVFKGRLVTILSGGGNTFTNNLNMQMTGGADVVVAAGKTISFVSNGTAWFQQ